MYFLVFLASLILSVALVIVKNIMGFESSVIVGLVMANTYLLLIHIKQDKGN